MPKGSHKNSRPITLADLKNNLQNFRDGVREEIREAKRELLTHITSSFVERDKRFDLIDQHSVVVNTKLDAIMSGEILVTRKQFQKLLTGLKGHGIALNETEILAA